MLARTQYTAAPQVRDSANLTSVTLSVSVPVSQPISPVFKIQTTVHEMAKGSPLGTTGYTLYNLSIPVGGSFGFVNDVGTYDLVGQNGGANYTQSIPVFGVFNGNICVSAS